jgi:hypothetical protein
MFAFDADQTAPRHAPGRETSTQFLDPAILATLYNARVKML